MAFQTLIRDIYKAYKLIHIKLYSFSVGTDFTRTRNTETHKKILTTDYGRTEAKVLKKKKRNHICSQRKKRTCTPHYQNDLFLKSLIYPLNAKFPSHTTLLR